MLLTKQVEVLLHGDRIKYYENLGYEIPRVKNYNYNYYYVPRGSKIIVNVEDLAETSINEVELKCDNCGKVFKRTYHRYLLHHDNEFGDLCKSCSKIKREKTCIKKYGVTNPSYIEDVKEKRKQTSLQRFGVECSFQSEEIKDKIKKSLIDKYGVENISQSDEITKKKEETCLEHYGVRFSVQDETIKEKRKQTCLERYGVEHSFQSPEIRRKAALSYYKNGSQSVSRPQRKLYNLLKTIYKNCELNYPLESFCLDCMIEENGQKIDIEYDGQHWHKFKEEKDKQRNEVCFQNGYKVLRIKGNMDIPNKEQLTNAISELLNSDKNYDEIYTDWNYEK